MDIAEQRHGAVTVLRPVGPLVQADAEVFSARLQTALKQSLGRIVIDVSAIPFVDSTGLEALLDASERLQEMGQALRLTGATDTVREILEVTGLAPRFEHFAEVQDATRSFL